jgi:hypothetical protein
MEDTPAADVSRSITDDLLGKLNHANWKERQAGIEEAQKIAAQARRIKADLGGLPDALKVRCICISTRPTPASEGYGTH